MKNYKKTYKNYHIIKFGDDYIITDEHGTTKGTTLTEDGAKAQIDYLIQQEEEKAKAFDSLKTLNKNTRQAQGYLMNYNTATKKELEQCYKTHSKEKQEAFNYCFDLYMQLKGQERAIPTASRWFFTFAFDFEYHGKKYLCYITPTQNYKIEL